MGNQKHYLFLFMGICRFPEAKSVKFHPAIIPFGPYRLKMKYYLIFGLLLLVNSANADIEEGLEAYLSENYKQAFIKLKKPALQGHSLAQMLLGDIYFSGQGALQDYLEAAKWYRKAAQQDQIEAQFKLGSMYDIGQGVIQDFKEAIKWYRKSGEQGYSESQQVLGNLYFKGLGVPQDYNEAAKWYRMAAYQDDSIAQLKLGNMYVKGQGVLQDYVQAHLWFNLASANGDADGAEYREWIARKMGSADITEAQRLAREWKPN
ncbi:MAG: sel1 repeat family protein [Thiotrichales bacterium]|nr:sel1 repeat family protein [Thiotrichales bacterium]